MKEKTLRRISRVSSIFGIIVAGWFLIEEYLIGVIDLFSISGALVLILLLFPSHYLAWFNKK